MPKLATDSATGRRLTREDFTPEIIAAGVKAYRDTGDSRFFEPEDAVELIIEAMINV